MLRLRVTSDCQPRTKNGQPAQTTTGVAKTSWIQFDSVGSSQSCHTRDRAPSLSPRHGHVRDRHVLRSKTQPQTWQRNSRIRNEFPPRDDARVLRPSFACSGLATDTLGGYIERMRKDIKTSVG